MRGYQRDLVPHEVLLMPPGILTRKGSARSMHIKHMRPGLLVGNLFFLQASQVLSAVCPPSQIRH